MQLSTLTHLEALSYILHPKRNLYLLLSTTYRSL